MNRVIKFRAWIKPLKKMAKVYTLGLTGIQGTVACCDGELLSGLDWTTMDLMQFTGLTDKNGKEVYGGDVYTDDSLVDDYGTPQRALIGFDEGAFRIIETNCTCGACVGAIIDDASDFTVIGNIYENPELLKVKND